VTQERGRLWRYAQDALDPLLHVTPPATASWGILQPGKRADVVVADGDPADLTGLGERVRAVYEDGVLVAGGL
jgi:imidazolonepropionase-like amidohydrolase